MKRILLALALLAAPLLAQQPAPNPEEVIQKLVTVKYIDPASIRNLLGNFGVDIRLDERTKVVVLSGPRRKVTTAEDAIKQLDVPAAAQKDIELTVFFVMATDGTTVPGSGSPIPQDLQSTVATLKATFPFKTYLLLDALSLRARSGVGADSTGQLSGGRLTAFRVRSASLEADGSMIRLDNLHAGLKIPTSLGAGKGITFIDTGISTDVVDVKEGQKLVVGRSSLEGPDKAMFLILIAKVAN
ncbi:conserved exported hypothetical protein [Candidatus Sulfopaludibacter sp. SbA4]|nr:conserved exported hypothetical protein [Candidatus Sulfopaludibacter sp. SbA4]